jgi:hypothetical protein
VQTNSIPTNAPAPDAIPDETQTPTVSSGTTTTTTYAPSSSPTSVQIPIDESLLSQLPSETQTTIQLKSEYAQAQQNYLKWKEAWHYYEKEALELAKEQRNGASIAYREGDIDYIGFLQLVKDAIEIEQEGWQTYQEYLKRQFKLEYYINK